MSLHLLTYMESMPLLDTFSYKLIQNLLLNIYKIPTSSAEKMAELCSVSPSALRKFVTLLGYETYSEFRVAFRNFHDKNNDPEGYTDYYVARSSIQTVTSVISTVLTRVQESISDEMIDAAAQELARAKKIVICSNSPDSTQLLFGGQFVLRQKKLRSIHRPKKLSDFDSEITDSTVVLLYRVGRNSECFTFSDITKLSKRNTKSILISSYVNPLEANVINYPLCFNGLNGLEDEHGINAILSCLMYKFMQH